MTEDIHSRLGRIEGLLERGFSDIDRRFDEQGEQIKVLQSDLETVQTERAAEKGFLGGARYIAYAVIGLASSLFTYLFKS